MPKKVLDEYSSDNNNNNVDEAQLLSSGIESSFK